MQNVSTFLPTEYNTEAQSIARRRRLAEALQAQSLQPIQGGGMVSGHYVRSSPLQGLAQVLRGFTAHQDLEKADADEKALASKVTQGRNETLAKALRMAQGDPGRVPVLDPQETEQMADFGTPQPPNVGAVAPDQMGAATTLMGSGDPMLTALGGSLFSKAIEPQKPMVVGRSLIDPRTGQTVGVDETWREEQKAAREQRAQELQAKLADARLTAQERIAAQKELAEMQLQGRLDMIRLAASLRPPRQEPQPQIVQTDSGPVQVDRSGNATPITLNGQPVKPKALERALPNSAINELTDKGGAVTNTTRLIDNFKDEYGGALAGPIGNVQNLVGRNIGLRFEDQAKWWQDYQQDKNIKRNKLFGSALTVTEKNEFEKADINPGMTPKQIRANLQRQHELALQAAQKLAGAYTASGYSPAAIEAALGVPLGQLQDAPKAPSSPGSAAPKVIDFNSLPKSKGKP